MQDDGPRGTPYTSDDEEEMRKGANTHTTILNALWWAGQRQGYVFEMMSCGHSRQQKHESRNTIPSFFSFWACCSC